MQPYCIMKFFRGERHEIHKNMECGRRDSNMEFLRLFAMFFVMVVHACYYSLKAPTANDLINTCGNSLFKIFIESISIGSVNIFVMISGFYGIKLTKGGGN